MLRCPLPQIADRRNQSKKMKKAIFIILDVLVVVVLPFAFISGQIHSVKYVVFYRFVDSLTSLIDRSRDCLV